MTRIVRIQEEEFEMEGTTQGPKSEINYQLGLENFGSIELEEGMMNKEEERVWGDSQK